MLSCGAARHQVPCPGRCPAATIWVFGWISYHLTPPAMPNAQQEPRSARLPIGAPLSRRKAGQVQAQTAATMRRDKWNSPRTDQAAAQLIAEQKGCCTCSPVSVAASTRRHASCVRGPPWGYANADRMTKKCGHLSCTCCQRRTVCTPTRAAV